MIHYIDLEDHLSPLNPFAFLNDDNWEEKKHLVEGIGLGIENGN